MWCDSLPLVGKLRLKSNHIRNISKKSIKIDRSLKNRIVTALVTNNQECFHCNLSKNISLLFSCSIEKSWFYICNTFYFLYLSVWMTLSCRGFILTSIGSASSAFMWTVSIDCRPVRHSSGVRTGPATVCDVHGWQCHTRQPATLWSRPTAVQYVINAAARLTIGMQRYDHITPLLTELH